MKIQNRYGNTVEAGAYIVMARYRDGWTVPLSSYASPEAAGAEVLERITHNASETICGAIAGQVTYYFVPVEAP